MKVVLAVLVLASLALAARAPVPQGPAFPVSWSDELKLKTIDDIPKALQAKWEETLELSVNGATRVVDTCEAYLDAKRNGFTAETTADMAQETWFRSRCRPLEVLKDARAAKASHVRDLAADEKWLTLLPPSFDHPLSTDEEDEVRAAERLKQSWGAFNANLVAKAVDKNTLEVRDTEKNWIHTLRVLARGDFDRDGVDDILLSVSEHSDRGSFRSQSLVTLTRQRAEDSLKVSKRIE